MLFRHRRHAGQKLAESLTAYQARAETLVLALPRGGVPVAWEIARALYLPLDLFCVRRLGVPGQEEVALGALASGGVQVVNEELLRRHAIPEAVLAARAAHAQEALARCETQYRGRRPLPSLTGRTLMVVDDGVATGASMRAAITALRAHAPARLIVAVPVAPPDTCAALRAEADEVVCPLTPNPFHAVGWWYDEFGALGEEEMQRLLVHAWEVLPPA